jgi:hypothetical protein
MMATRLAIAALVTVGLAGAPFAAEAKKYKPERRPQTRSGQRA